MRYDQDSEHLQRSDQDNVPEVPLVVPSGVPSVVAWIVPLVDDKIIEPGESSHISHLR